jgi:hypothetical protein
MPVNLPNLTWLRNVKIPGFPEFGVRLREALKASEGAHNQLEQQTNGNLSGSSQPPPQVSGLSVTAQNGIFHFSIAHNAEFYRGVSYHVEYATDANFTNPFPIDLGSAREHRATLGNLTLYARASASYGISAPGPWVYYGGSQPIGIVGGGVSGPALPEKSQGSGTGFAGQGLSGPGQTAFRGISPPQRVS